jgi:hypothetical protein
MAMLTTPYAKQERAARNRTLLAEVLVVEVDIGCFFFSSSSSVLLFFFLLLVPLA